MFNKFKNIIKLVNNENIKNIYKKNIIITLLVMVLSITLIGVISHSSHINSSNWKEKQQTELNELQESRNETKEELSEFEIQFDTDRINLLTYSLDKNIPLDITTPWRFIYKVNGTFNLVIIVIVLLSINTITKEYSYGTIKQILIRPYHRYEILLAKHISIITISLLCIIVHFIISLIIGYILFRGNGSSTTILSILNNSVIEISVVKTIFQSYLCLFIESIIIITFAIMVSVLIKSNVVPLIATIMLWFGSGLITNYFAKYKLLKFTLFPHMKLSQYIYGENLMLQGNTLSLSIIILLIYFIIFNFIVYYYFSKQDVY